MSPLVYAILKTARQQEKTTGRQVTRVVMGLAAYAVLNGDDLRLLGSMGIRVEALGRGEGSPGGPGGFEVGDEGD